MRQIQLIAADRGVCLFRNNVGQGWAGKAYIHRGAPFRAEIRGGDVIVRQARPLQSGLCVGSSDLIGWRTITITPDMVGQTIAQFVASEVKAENGKLTEEQIAFINAVHSAGGFACVPRSVDEARDFFSK